MKHTFLLCTFVLLATMVQAQDRSLDEIAIKKVILQQEASWNRHDWDAFSGYFTNDATLINFVGQFWKGKNEIITHFKILSDCCLAPTSLKFEFKNAIFLKPDIAIVYIEETLFADKDYSVPFHKYKKGDIDYKMVTNVFVKINNEWRITAAQVTLINQVISPHVSAGKN